MIYKWANTDDENIFNAPDHDIFLQMKSIYLHVKCNHISCSVNAWIKVTEKWCGKYYITYMCQVIPYALIWSNLSSSDDLVSFIEDTYSGHFKAHM